MNSEYHPWHVDSYRTPDILLAIYRAQIDKSNFEYQIYILKITALSEEYVLATVPPQFENRGIDSDFFEYHTTFPTLEAAKLAYLILAGSRS
jgi:hypothetical protein